MASKRQTYRMADKLPALREVFAFKSQGMLMIAGRLPCSLQRRHFERLYQWDQRLTHDRLLKTNYVPLLI